MSYEHVVARCERCSLSISADERKAVERAAELLQGAVGCRDQRGHSVEVVE